MSDPILLTPGPLTTARETKETMLRDWGSRDTAFIAMTAEMRNRLLDVAHGSESHVAVPLQGSGTFIVEAAIATLVRKTDKLLVLANGAYGERMLTIAARLGLKTEALRFDEDKPVDPAAVEKALKEDSGITHVALVHCETTSGLLNPLAEIAGIVARHGKVFLLDAMSSFGALEIDLRKIAVAAVLASSNKCLEGVPGIGFALIEKSVLEAAKGVSPSLSFDLYEQWRGFEGNGQWRFTPPVQVVAALVEALRLLEKEGGPSARHARYRENFETLYAGVRKLGFDLYLDEKLQAPIIATFRSPQGFDFEHFYRALAERGFLIYPGKLTREESFRIGCIGDLRKQDFIRLVEAIGEIVRKS